MEESRASKVNEILKNVKTLAKNIKLPSLAPIIEQKQEVANAIGTPLQGTGFLRIIMYVIAGILLIGIILLGVDQWITPVFQRGPGSPGFISIPGTDNTEVFWTKLSKVSNIIIGTPAPVNATPGVPQAPRLSTNVIEGQSSYSLSMDVYIKDEYPQAMEKGQDQRVFFVSGQTVENPSLRVSLDNEKNTVYITCFDANGLQQSVIIDNVPIHKPFRIGIVMSSQIMEGYLNGFLVMTRQLKSTPKIPSTGDKIFAPGNIKTPLTVLSKGINVLNVRVFGYASSAEEMKGRMGDLMSPVTFNPPTDD
jgi:hypothetical protein